MTDREAATRSDLGRGELVKLLYRLGRQQASGVLTIRTPKQRYLVGRTGTVDVTVELPTGSRVDMTGAWAQVLG